MTTTTPLVTHAAMVTRAIGWLRAIKRCNVVLSEMDCGWIEVPDAIGFPCDHRNGSILIECKTSRADFRIDGRKKARRDGVGMGAYRFYLVPHGLVRAHEFETLIAGEEQLEPATRSKWGSSGWGLLYWKPETERITIERISQRFEPNLRAESLFLASALQRVQMRLDEPLHEYLRWERSPVARAKAIGA